MAVCSGRKRCRKSHDPPQLMIDTEVSKSMGKQVSTVVCNLSRHSGLNWWPPGECGTWFWESGSLSDPWAYISQHFRDHLEDQMRATPGTQSVPRPRHWVQTVVSMRSSEQVLRRMSSGKEGRCPSHSQVVSRIGAPVSKLRHGSRNVCLDTSCRETNTIVLKHLQAIAGLEARWPFSLLLHKGKMELQWDLKLWTAVVSSKANNLAFHVTISEWALLPQTMDFVLCEYGAW